jgi:hypothetical protein
MANQGYVLVYRSMMDKEDYFGHKFSTKEAWLDLIFLANHSDIRSSKRGINFDVKYGQIAYSQESLAKRWMWSRGKVKRYLKELENEHQIRLEMIQGINRLSTLITLTNYERLQKREQQTEQQNGHQTDIKRTSDDTVVTNVTNVTNENNKEKKGRKGVKKKKKETGAELIYPDCVERDLIDKYIDNRVIIKKKMTHYAKELFLLKIQKFHDKGEDVKTLIEKAIIGGWSDIYESKGASNGKNFKGRKQEPIKKAGTKSGREEKRPTVITIGDRRRKD